MRRPHHVELRTGGLPRDGGNECWKVIFIHFKPIRNPKKAKKTQAIKISTDALQNWQIADK